MLLEGVRAGLARLAVCLIRDVLTGQAFSLALPSVTTIEP